MTELQVTPELILELAKQECLRQEVPASPENLLYAACCVASDFVRANAKLMRGGFYRNVGGKNGSVEE